MRLSEYFAILKKGQKLSKLEFIWFLIKNFIDLQELSELVSQTSYCDYSKKKIKKKKI